MTRFQLFDAVKLKEAIALTGGKTAAAGTPGAIVEVLRDGEAYMVELFGGWVKRDAQGDLAPADRTDPEAFMETIGLETVDSQQLRLVKPASETVGVRSQLLMMLDELPEELLEEIADFAEFLQQKQRRRIAQP
ncbi:MAG: DUF2281 domain-containing protein [Chloroflexi bacterium]|nr:DUF2281 domain-containing protein [Chloroflexota bacterium]